MTSHLSDVIDKIFRDFCHILEPEFGKTRLRSLDVWPLIKRYSIQPIFKEILFKPCTLLSLTGMETLGHYAWFSSEGVRLSIYLELKCTIKQRHSLGAIHHFFFTKHYDSWFWNVWRGHIHPLAHLLHVIKKSMHGQGLILWFVSYVGNCSSQSRHLRECHT